MKYKISKHAVDRMYERNITKGEVHYNLYTKPLKITPIKYDSFGRSSYEKFAYNKINTRINPKNNVVSKVSRYHTKKYEKIMRSKEKRK